VENIFGSYYNDILIGDNGANTIRGNAGDDTIVGLDGNDYLNGGNGIDIVNYVYSNFPAMINLANATTYFWDTQEQDGINEFENIIATFFGDYIVGNS